MTKYEKISVLAKETARSIGENKESWMNYLDVASRLYKYPFEDQILIYAQRPDATACAPLEMWNEKMFCWVNRGAKGIALIDQESDYLIAPKTEQDTVVYLQAVLGRLGSSILTSEAVTTHAAYEYDSSLQTMKPFNHVGILQGLMAVGEEKMTYQSKMQETFREEAKKEKRH